MKSLNKIILNIGCGEQYYGDIRLDFIRTDAVNVLGDCQHLPFKNDVFTVVYERNVLEHLPNPAQHLLDVKRVLRENGTLLLITDNAACIKYYLLGTHMGGYSKHKGKDVHYSIFTTEHIKNLMDFCGLKINQIKLIDTEYFTHYFDLIIRLFIPSISYPRIMVKGTKT